MLSGRSWKRPLYAIGLAVVLLILLLFFLYWRSLNYDLYTTVCDPSAPDNECHGYNVGVAFVLTGAVKLNFWGPLVTAFATVAIAAFTVVLALTGRSTAKITIRQTGIARRQMLLQGLQADILEKQKELGRQQFFAEHRPNLEVRFARLLPSNPVETGRPKRTFIEFSVINTGTSTANITGSRVRLDWLESPADVPNPDDIGGADIIAHNRMIASARIRYPMEIEDTFSGGFSERPDRRLSQSTLILFGWIVYEDDRGSEFGTTRTTYFCQMLENSTGRFKPAESLPDWNFIH